MYTCDGWEEDCEDAEKKIGAVTHCGLKEVDALGRSMLKRRMRVAASWSEGVDSRVT